MTRVTISDSPAEVTILLSLTFFLNITTEMMPETSEAVPLIGRHARMSPARCRVVS